MTNPQTHEMTPVCYDQHIELLIGAGLAEHHADRCSPTALGKESRDLFGVSAEDLATAIVQGLKGGPEDAVSELSGVLSDWAVHQRYKDRERLEQAVRAAEDKAARFEGQARHLGTVVAGFISNVARFDTAWGFDDAAHSRRMAARDRTPQ